MKKSSIYITLSLLVFSMLFNSCAKNPVTGKRQLVFMSEAQEVAMGASYDPQITASFGLYEDATIQAYINEKGNEMAAISHRPHLDYEFKILDSPVVNAFAVPGGYVYFTRGIMAHFNNEAEFAGVLGHEIGHVTARHSVIQQRNQILGQVGLIAGLVAIPELANFAQPASEAMGLMFLKFGRDAESQSDELGVEYSSKIGYDAKEMALFFNTLARKQEEAGVAIPEFLSTHPSPLGRQENVDELADKWQEKLDLNDPVVGRNKFLQMIDGIVYGPDPRQGFVENFVFYHPTLKFELPVPNGWNHQNSPQQFQMAPADGKALMFLTIGKGATLEEAYTATLEGYGLELMKKTNTVINGNDAIVISAKQVPAVDPNAPVDPNAADAPYLQAKITLIEYDGLIYEISGVAQNTEFASYSGLFANTMNNFNQLTDQDKLNRMPERIKVVTINSQTSLSTALKNNGISSGRLEEMAIVNGMQLADQVPSGTMIKVLQ